MSIKNVLNKYYLGPSCSFMKGVRNGEMCVKAAVKVLLIRDFHDDIT